jgi:hypothetical protein
MNVLNQATAAKPATDSSASDVRFDLATLIPKGSVFTVIGQVRNWQLGFAGRISCTLRLSAGDLTLSANRDTMSLDIADGDWVRSKLMRRHDDSTTMHVVNAVATQSETMNSWVPEALYHRVEAMNELRRLLSTLEPALQGVFLSVMLDRVVQRRFFFRAAAADHHCYPGGLFDQSVAAANLASRSDAIDPRVRGIATLASLLFDIGKATDERLQFDRPRRWPELRPHPTTAPRLKSALTRLASSRPQLAADLVDVLDCNDVLPATSPLSDARRQVRLAVQQSWGPESSFPTAQTTPGARA